MTIAEYMSKCKEQDNKIISNNGLLYSEVMANACEIWSNDACKGYFIHAAKSAGLDDKTIQKVLDEMRWSFDFKSIDDAAEVYRNF